MARPRFGYLRIHVMLRREGWRLGKNRVYRLSGLEGLQVRMRVRRQEARFSFRRKDVVAALERVRTSAGLPASIAVDHGT